MKKTYINPKIKVVMINFTQPLMAGSVTTVGDVNAIYDGESEDGLEADGREFDSWEDDDLDCE